MEGGCSLLSLVAPCHLLVPRLFLKGRQRKIEGGADRVAELDIDTGICE